MHGLLQVFGRGDVHISRIAQSLLCITATTCGACGRYWNDQETMQKLGKAFGDMPGINEMFAGAARMDDKEGGEDEAEADAPESDFLNAAMEGDVEAIKKAITEGGAGAPSFLVSRVL